MRKWIFVLLGVFGLVSVRIFENTLFYDPFLTYFKLADAHASLPEFTWGKLILHHFFRFSLNLFFSLVIIQNLFQNRNWTIQAGILMGIVFLVSLFVYLLCIANSFQIGYLFSFYMRRFVIQPIVLLLIIPIFYYRKAILEKNS